MSYALTILWYERRRFLPAVVAVAFSAVLVALQCGLLLGMFAFASLPVDHTRADVWVGGAGVVLALPPTFALERAADWLGVGVLLSAWLLACTAALTVGTAVLSGLLALRPLRHTEPAVLLRC